MRFKGLDLNLLVALDVLLDESNVSRAAERLHLSQPALSAALGRLRDYFDDPLLVSHGKRMVPTAQALALRPLLKELLAQAEVMIAQSIGFDPATSHRVFRIGVSDYLSIVLFSRLVRSLQKLAPFVKFDLQQPSDELLPMVDRGEIDLLLTPEEHCLAEHPTELIFEERHVVVGWRENPVVQSPLSEEVFYQAGHVAVTLGRQNRASFAETHLATRGITRRVEITASSFVVVPDLIVGTPRIAVMHERLARIVAERQPVIWQPMPFAFPVMREMAQYHRTRAKDAGLRWLVEQVHATADLPNY